MFYSKETGGFYSTAVHGSNMPADVVEITDTLYRDLLDGQASGKRIAGDASGAPVLLDLPAPNHALVITSQIDALERQYLMPRATREFMLMFMEANAPAEVLAVNPGYQAVKAFDNQIVALRGQLS